MKLSPKTIREVKKQLCSRSILPNKDGNYIACFVPCLRNGVVYMGIVAMHPSSFLDMFGAKLFRIIKADVSKRRIENYIKKWEKKK